MPKVPNKKNSGDLEGEERGGVPPPYTFFLLMHVWAGGVRHSGREGKPVDKECQAAAVARSIRAGEASAEGGVCGGGGGGGEITCAGGGGGGKMCGHFVRHAGYGTGSPTAAGGETLGRLVSKDSTPTSSFPLLVP